MKMISTCFLTTLSTPVSFLFLEIITFSIVEHNHRLQIKDKHLIVHPKQEAVTGSERKILILNTLHSRLVFPIE